MPVEYELLLEFLPLPLQDKPQAYRCEVDPLTDAHVGQSTAVRVNMNSVCTVCCWYSE